MDRQKWDCRSRDGYLSQKNTYTYIYIYIYIFIYLFITSTTFCGVLLSRTSPCEDPGLLAEYLSVEVSRPLNELHLRLLAPHSTPRGSKYPTFKDPGSKNHTPNGFWDQTP